MRFGNVGASARPNEPCKDPLGSASWFAGCVEHIELAPLPLGAFSAVGRASSTLSHCSKRGSGATGPRIPGAKWGEPCQCPVLNKPRSGRQKIFGGWPTCVAFFDLIYRTESKHKYPQGPCCVRGVWGARACKKGEGKSLPRTCVRHVRGVAGPLVLPATPHRDAPTRGCSCWYRLWGMGSRKTCHGGHPGKRGAKYTLVHLELAPRCAKVHRANSAEFRPEGVPQRNCGPE